MALYFFPIGSVGSLKRGNDDRCVVSTRDLRGCLFGVCDHFPGAILVHDPERVLADCYSSSSCR